MNACLMARAVVPSDDDDDDDHDDDDDDDDYNLITIKSIIGVAWTKGWMRH